MWRGWNEIAFLAGYFELASALLSKSLLKLGKIQKDSDKIQTPDPHQHIIFNGLVTLEIRSRSPKSNLLL